MRRSLRRHLKSLTLVWRSNFGFGDDFGEGENDGAFACVNIYCMGLLEYCIIRYQSRKFGKAVRKPKKGIALRFNLTSFLNSTQNHPFSHVTHNPHLFQGSS
jgi:hypothetical protein